MFGKKLAAALSAAVIAAALILSLGSCQMADKGEQWLDSVSINSYLSEDGSLTVCEDWVIEADTYVDYSLDNPYKIFSLYDSDFPGTPVAVSDFYVIDVDNNKTFTQSSFGSRQIGTYYGKPDGKEFELGFYTEALSSGKHTYRIVYTLSNMVTGYGDTAVLYWKQYDQSFSLYIENYKSTLFLPSSSAVTDDTLGWFHSETEGAYFSKDSDALRFTAQKIAAGTPIEVRVLMPKELFDYTAFKKTSPVYVRDQIIDIEETWRAEWEAELIRAHRLAVAGIVLMTVFIAAGIAYVILFKKLYRKTKNEYPEYQREIPKDWTPAEAGHLFYYYDGGAGEKKNNRGNLLSATILDLYRRDYLIIAVPTDGKDYTIDMPSIPKAKFDDLKPHEKSLYSLLAQCKASNFGKPFTMKDFERFAKSSYTAVNASVKGFTEDSAKKLRYNDYISGTQNKLKGIRIGGIALAVISFILFAAASAMNYMYLGLMAFGIALIVGTPVTAKLNERGEREYAYFKGLEKFMSDFSNLKKYEIPQLVLWEEYLVYATMMGISEKVLKALKLRYPELADPVYCPNPFFASYLLLSYRFGAVGVDLGGSMSRAFNNVIAETKALAVPKVNTAGGKGWLGGFGGSGGGFRGGGGGFGGGGGGIRH